MSLVFAIYVILGFVGAVSFVLLYGLHPMTRKTWWRSSVGQNLMAYSFVMCLLYVQGIINLWLPQWGNRAEARLVLSILGIVVVWWRLLLLVREIRAWYRKKAAHGPEEVSGVPAGDDPGRSADGGL
jgi:hypothetical protein